MCDLFCRSSSFFNPEIFHWHLLFSSVVIWSLSIVKYCEMNRWHQSCRIWIVFLRSCQKSKLDDIACTDSTHCFGRGPSGNGIFVNTRQELADEDIAKAESNSSLLDILGQWRGDVAVTTTKHHAMWESSRGGFLGRERWELAISEKAQVPFSPRGCDKSHNEHILMMEILSKNTQSSIAEKIGVSLDWCQSRKKLSKQNFRISFGLGYVS